MGVFLGSLAAELRICGGCCMSWNVEVEIKYIYMHFLNGSSIRRSAVNKLSQRPQWSMAAIRNYHTHDALSTMKKLLEYENLIIIKIPLNLMWGGRSPPEHSAQRGGRSPPQKFFGGTCPPRPPRSLRPCFKVIFNDRHYDYEKFYKNSFNHAMMT